MSVEIDASSWIDLTLQAADVLDKKSVETYWNNRTRPDGRLLGQTRRTTVQTGVISKHAAGSAIAKVGDTTVLSAVTLQVGQPLTQQNLGDILVEAEDAVMKSQIQRLLDDAVDLKQLSIVSGKAAFRLCVTVQVLENRGSIVDAAILASVAACCDTKLPLDTVWQDEKVWLQTNNEPNSVNDERFRSLQMTSIPIPLSLGAWIQQTEDKSESQLRWIVDPSEEEEEVLSSILTVAVDARDPDQILLMHLVGDVPISHADLALAMKIAGGRGEEMKPLFL